MTHKQWSQNYFKSPSLPIVRGLANTIPLFMTMCSILSSWRPCRRIWRELFDQQVYLNQISCLTNNYHITILFLSLFKERILKWKIKGLFYFTIPQWNMKASAHCSFCSILWLLFTNRGWFFRINQLSRVSVYNLSLSLFLYFTSSTWLNTPSSPYKVLSKSLRWLFLLVTQETSHF